MKLNLWLVAMLFTLGTYAIANNGGKIEPENKFSSNKNENDPKRNLASGDAEEDLKHYHGLSRRLGVDIGLMIPFTDFQTAYNMGQAIGVHFTWEAIPPFSFIVGMLRTSANHKTDPANGKLSVTAFTMGTQVSFPVKRFSPFVKLAGGLYFNDISFESTRDITAGYDTLLTTVGISAGLGFDFIVGREVSLGLEGQYHYLVPKKIKTSGAEFNLGSSMAVINFRVNF